MVPTEAYVAAKRHGQGGISVWQRLKKTLTTFQIAFVGIIKHGHTGFHAFTGVGQRVNALFLRRHPQHCGQQKQGY